MTDGRKFGIIEEEEGAEIVFPVSVDMMMIIALNFLPPAPFMSITLCIYVTSTA